MAEAELKTGEVQDLADNIHAIKAAAAGYDLTFCIVLELSGKDSLPDDVVEKVNKALALVSPKLQLR